MDQDTDMHIHHPARLPTPTTLGTLPVGLAVLVSGARADVRSRMCRGAQFKALILVEMTLSSIS